MEENNFGSGLFLLAVSLFTARLAYQLGFGEFTNPGPGLFPLLLAVIIGAMSIGMVCTNWPQRGKRTQERSILQGIKWRIVLIVLGAILGYGVAFNSLGFCICTFLFILSLLRFVGYQRWSLSLVFSLATTVGAHLLFNVVLDSQLPKGLLDF